MRCTRCGSPLSTDDLEKSVVWCKSCVAAGHEHWWKRREQK